MSKGELPKEWFYTDLDNVLLKIVGGGTPHTRQLKLQAHERA